MAESKIADNALEGFWSRSPDDVFRELDVTSAGLTTAEARRRAAGRADRDRHREHTTARILARQFTSPITLILIGATLIAAALGETTDAAIILAIVLAGGLLSFWQEHAASRAVEELLASVRLTVEVVRDGSATFVPADLIVPGDVVILDTGDLIPGDCLLLEAEEVLVDEAPLTGESYPVEKSPEVVTAEAPLAKRTNVLFQGTHVVRGKARALVVATGTETEFGQIAASLKRHPPKTRFERGIGQFGALLLRAMIVLVVVIFVANVLLDRPVIDSLLFSVALAVGLTPQLLPAVVSVSLSLGARRMARAKVIVKRLSAIEDLGGMDVLCTDKTGTLTVGTVRFDRALDIEGNDSEVAHHAAYLNAFHHTGYANPIDAAILDSAQFDAAGTCRLGEAPYDFQRKRLSVLVSDTSGATLLTKGALDSVLAVCTTARMAERQPASIDKARRSILQRFEALSGDGYRVLGVAQKPMPANTAVDPSAETGMEFLGFVTFTDPPKPNIERTLANLRGLGISLRMITGDNRLVAKQVAKSVGLGEPRVLTGDDLRAMDQADLAKVVAEVGIFAEVDPVQKERIIAALRTSGHDVGYLGDGINDAPALHAADVGISVEQAVEVARDSASIVLLEKNLDVLMDGVRLGRQTFANTLKYIFVTTSANFGNMASMAVATLFLPFLPLLPFQILLINFLTDLPAMTIATDAVDSEQLAAPGAWNLKFIRTFMIVFGLISSAFDLFTFGILRLALDAGEELFRGGWFVESVATEIAVMLVLRTRRPCFRSRPGTALFISSIAVGIAALAIPFSPMAGTLGFVSLSTAVLLALLGITAAYVLVTEYAKSRFYRTRDLALSVQPASTRS